jgi:hypothetical protein
MTPGGFGLVAFPTIRELLAQTGLEESKGAHEEYLDGVDYHLGFSRSAASQCSSSLYDAQVMVDHTGTAFYINRTSALDLVRWGDIAVREAASVIEVGWVAISHLLQLRLDTRTQMKWRDSGGKPGLFQKRLRALGTTSAGALAEDIRRMFDSLGYDLLQGYRNWVTHRGAPKLEPALRILGPIPMPVEIQQEQDETQRAFLLRTEAMLHLLRTMRVTCWPIAPPVQMTYSANIGVAEQAIDLPGGIHIDAGATNIQIANSRIQSGSLWDDVAAFRARNPLTIEQGRSRLAGEALALYSAGDYVMAVQMVTRFAQEAVCTVFDGQLCRAVEELQGPLIDRAGFDPSA